MDIRALAPAFRGSTGLVLGLVLSLASAGVASSQAPSLEAAVKATYLYKFAAFVEWPAATESAAQPMQICVAGADPFGPLLDHAVQGQKIGARAITVSRLDHVDKTAPCQILFIAGSPRQSAADARAAVRGLPVLTVTDNAADPQARGVIDFVLKDNHVRFRIDGRAAAENGLAISSKLLNLAVKTAGAP